MTNRRRFLGVSVSEWAFVVLAALAIPYIYSGVLSWLSYYEPDLIRSLMRLGGDTSAFYLGVLTIGMLSAVLTTTITHYLPSLLLDEFHVSLGVAAGVLGVLHLILIMLILGSSAI